jgi:hypothetical protein
MYIKALATAARMLFAGSRKFSITIYVLKIYMLQIVLVHEDVCRAGSVRSSLVGFCWATTIKVYQHKLNKNEESEGGSKAEEAKLAFKL